MAGQPTATLTEGATSSHVLALKDGSTIRQSLGDLATQLLVSPELAALIGNYDLFQGEWDASGGVFPSGVAKGQFWRVSQAGAGTVDGVAFAASDVLIALVDDASTEVYAGNWHKAAYAGVSHEHAISAIVGLQAALDAKAGAAQGDKADTAVQPGDLAAVATSGSSDDLSEGTAKLLMTAPEREKLAGIEAGVFPVSDRPGDHPEAFSASYTGAGAAKDPLSGGTEVVGAGMAHVLTGAGTIAARWPVALNYDVVEFTLRFRRISNPSDPNNHAVRLQVAWLDKNKAVIGSVQTLASRSDALTSSGLIELSARVSALAVEDVVTPPVGAVYACPFMQAYGEDGTTAVETLRSREVTDLHVLDSADLSTLIAETQAARDQAAAAADLVATETLDTMADVASYTRAAGVGAVVCKGGYARGDGLGGSWIYDQDGVEVTASPPELLIGADGANYRMAAANLVYRSKPDITTLTSATDIAVGQTITILSGDNSEPENFSILPAATYVANGTTVIDLPAGQAVSRRMRFSSRAEAAADTRPDAWFTAGTVIEAGGSRYEKSATAHLSNAGGATFKVLPAADGTFNLAAFGWTDGVADGLTPFETASAYISSIGGGILRCPTGTINVPGAGVVKIYPNVWVFCDEDTIFASGTGGEAAHHSFVSIRDGGKLFGGKVSQSDYVKQSGAAGYQAFNKVGITTQGALTGKGIVISGVGFEKCIHSFVYAFDLHQDILIEKCYTYGQQVGQHVAIDGDGLVTDWNVAKDAAALAAGTQVRCLTNFYNSGSATHNVTIRGQNIRNINDCFAAPNGSAKDHKIYGNECIKDTEGYFGGYGLDFNGCSDSEGYGNTLEGFAIGAYFHAGATGNKAYGNTYRCGNGTMFDSASKNHSWGNTVDLRSFGTGAKQRGAFAPGAGVSARNGSIQNSCADNLHLSTAVTSTASATISAVAEDDFGGFLITTSAAHGYKDRQIVEISGASGADINGVWDVRYENATQFSLIGSVYAAGYTSGGTVFQSAVGAAYLRVQNTVQNYLVVDGMYLDGVGVGMWSTTDGQSYLLPGESAQLGNVPTKARGNNAVYNTRRFLGGLSATGVHARNLRGEATMLSGTTTTIVTFPNAEVDTGYFIFLSNTGADLGLRWSGKTTAGFTVTHDAPGSDNVLHWMIVR